MITKEEIKSLAKLAKLEIPEERLGQFAAAFSDIIAFADQINRSVPDGAQAASLLELPMEALRGDVVEESLPAEKITSGVKAENGYFPVRRVVK